MIEKDFLVMENRCILVVYKVPKVYLKKIVCVYSEYL